MFKKVENVFPDDFPTEAVCVKYDHGNVWFLLTEQGEACVIHVLARGRSGKLKLREAANCLVNELKDKYKMLIAPVKKRSVLNMCVKLGYKDGGKITLNGSDYRMIIYGEEL